MNANRRLWLGVVIALGLLILAALPATPLALPGEAQTSGITTGPEFTVSGMPIDEAIVDLWRESDGDVAGTTANRSWLWGPTALATTVEYGANASNRREVVYYDKARLEINDPGASSGGWYVSGGLLVTEMLSGDIPITADASARLDPPAVPVAGDIEGSDAPTYATLAAHASILGERLSDGAAVELAGSRVGAEITASLGTDGSIVDEAMTGSGVSVGAYDDVTGHNIAAPFVDWTSRQPYPATWLIGRPLTEPLWVSTTILGAPKTVLLQAFERRVLTYTPDNADGWQVESGNAGLHYRLWRGLEQPEDPELVSLASLEPYGESLVAAGEANNLDPYMLVAISLAAGNGNPVATAANGGSGILIVRPGAAESFGGGDLLDPVVNASLGAQTLASWTGGVEAPNWRTVLAGYFTGPSSSVDPMAVSRFVDATMAAFNELQGKHPVNVDDGESEEPPPAPPAPGGAGNVLGTGRAAYYAQSYDRNWWERTMRLYESWGTAIPGWQYDPNGYYCVRPGYLVGQRLQLEANGVTITCTIGDTVNQAHVAQWQSRWVIELNWDAFRALGLDRNNTVTVTHVGPRG